MAFIYPSPAARIYIPVELSGDRGETVFSVAHRRPGATIYWHLDGEYLGSTSGPHEMALTPTAGTHTVTLVDEEGERLINHFEILEKRSEEHTSELQSLMRISYAVFCLKQKRTRNQNT